MTDILVKKQNVVLDATVLTSLMNCANFVDLRYNRRFVSLTGKSNSLECGSIVHKYLEVYYKCRINGMKLSEAHSVGYTAAQLYIMGCKQCTSFTPIHYSNEVHECDDRCILKPLCGHQVNEYPGVTNTPVEPPPDKAWVIGWSWVLRTIEDYHQFYRNDSWVPLEIEIVKSKVLYEDDELRVLWKSKLDWIVDTDSGIRPVDHKSMKQNRSTTKLNNQFMGQCHIVGTHTMFLNKIGFQKTLPFEKRFIRQGVSYDLDTLNEWQSLTLPFYARMLLAYNEMNYWPMNHVNCQGKFGDCPYLKVCESPRANRERVLMEEFTVGEEWNPTNEDSDAD